MVSIDIEPIHGENSNCIEDLVITVAKWKNRDYELMYLDSWGFDYNVHDEYELISNKISENNGNHQELLSKFHGINVYMNDSINREEIIEFFERKISESIPIAIVVDTYYCSWMKHLYSKVHQDHVILLTGIDLSTREIQLIDGAIKVNSKIEELKKMYLEIVIMFEFEEVEKFEIESIYSEVLKHIPKNQDIKKLELLKADFRNMDIIKEIDKSEDALFSSELIIKINDISRDRLKFAEALEYIKRVYNTTLLDEWHGKMKEVGFKWNMIRGRIIKALYEGEYDKHLKKIYSIISNIVEEELEVLEGIQCSICSKSSYLNNNPKYITKLKNTVEEESYSKENIMIDLEKYFNNKGFGPNKDACFSTGGGIHLIDNFKNMDFYRWEDLKFIIPSMTDVKFDNIVCKGQKIDIPEGKYSKIYFVGSSEWGNYIDEVEVIYEKETHIEDICFTDWGAQKAKFPREKAIWSGQGAVVENEKIQYYINVSIFMNYINVEKDKVLKGIILPECSNMHIFSMTIVK